MRKLVLGIALVVCLDAAFIWMMGNRAEVPEMARAVVPHRVAPAYQHRPSVEPVPINDSEEPDERDFVTPSSRVYRRQPKPGSKSQASAGRANDPKTASEPSSNATRLFPDKIIYIGRDESPEAVDPPSQISSSKDRSQSDFDSVGNSRLNKKRSFESRAFGVIKKPFKWIKSLASKLGR